MLSGALARWELAANAPTGGTAGTLRVRVAKPPPRKLFGLLRVTPGPRLPKLKHWRSITARRPLSAEPGRRSLCHLSDDVIFLILDYLYDVSPESVVALASVCSALYRPARYVQHRDVAIRLTPSKAEYDIGYFKYLSSIGLLSAVRTLRFAGALSWLDIRDEDYQFPTILHNLLDQMTGLCEIDWHRACRTVPEAVLQKLRQRPQVRLCASTDYRQQSAIRQLTHLTGSLNLYSLRVDASYTEAEEALRMMRPLKKLLLSCPNLRKLWLDIHTPRGTCLSYDPTYEYCGLGFTGGERPPPLEALDIIDYPWGVSSPAIGQGQYGLIGYPETGAEEDYWARHFDWSRLRRLAYPAILPYRYMSLAERISQHLTALDEVDFTIQGENSRHGGIRDYNEREMTDFFLKVPSILGSIIVPNFSALTTDVIVRHGPRLRSLELVRRETQQRIDGVFRSEIIDGISGNEDLLKLQQGLPKLEKLAIFLPDIKDEWPYDTLDILAGFPRLSSLKVAFGVPRAESDDEAPPAPHLTAAAAESLFRYMRERSPVLQHLEITSAVPRRWDSWTQGNSTTFLCELGVDRNCRTEAIITCTHLTKEQNAKLSRILRDREKPSPEDMAKVDFKVALEGPISWNEMAEMRKTDPLVDEYG